MRRRQALANDTPDHGCTAQTAAGQEAQPHLAAVAAVELHADIVEMDGGAVVFRAVDGNLELAGQEREFGMQRRPLADDFAIRPRIDPLIPGHAREWVRGGVAHAVAAGLDRVHLHAGQVGQNIRNVLQAGPVELNILACADVAVALVIASADLGYGPQLRAADKPVGYGDAQHGRQTLHIQPVLQAQGQKLRVRQLATQVACGLLAELRNALLDQVLV